MTGRKAILSTKCGLCFQNLQAQVKYCSPQKIYPACIMLQRGDEVDIARTFEIYETGAS